MIICDECYEKLGEFELDYIVSNGYERCSMCTNYVEYSKQIGIMYILKTIIDKNKVLEDEIKGLREMIQHFPGKGEEYIKAKRDFEELSGSK